MNSTKVPSIVQIEEKALSALMSQVKETVAADVMLRQTSASKKKFGVVDLWHCRSMSRTHGLTIR